MDFKLIKNLDINKKYLLIFFICILIFSLLSFTTKNYSNPNKEILFTIIIIIFGSLTIILVDNTKEIHKKALIIILMFGMLTAFISPIYIAHDEIEHFIRADLTSEGDLFPKYIENEGYNTNNYTIEMMFYNGQNIYNNELLTKPISSGHMISSSVFSQNLFYVYLAPAIGILFAKILDLPMIWTLLLARLCNLILYALIVSFAIKKVPKYKTFILLFSILPLSIFQASSVNCDAFLFAFGILNFAYLIKMYESEEIENKDLAIYLISGLSIGLIKFPYSFLLLLIFIIPQNKFKSNKISQIYKLLPLILIGICTLFSWEYGSKQILLSSRSIHMVQNNVSSINQISYILGNPLEFTSMFIQTLILSIYKIFIQDLTFYHQIFANNHLIYNGLYLIFFSILIFSQKSIELTKVKKIYSFLVFLLIYCSILLIQYLTWTPVGYWEILGVPARYFIPILPILPLAIGTNIFKKDIDNYLILFSIIFISGMLILTLAKFY